MATFTRKPSTSARLRNGAHERVDALADTIDSLRAKATGYVDESRERAAEVAHTLEDRIHERPLVTLFVASAVGFVLGCLVSRH